MAKLSHYHRILYGTIILFFLSLSGACAQESSIQIFLNSLSEDQKALCMLDLDAPDRSTWHFLPGVSHQRKGLSFYDLNEKQLSYFQDFLASNLSAYGYKKVEDIRALETVLAKIEGRPMYRDPMKYYVKFYGDPLKDKVWTWSFEGHHIYLHFNKIGEQASVIPRFLGTNPAIHQMENGETIEILKREQRIGLDLINSLNADLRSRAILSEKAYSDIITMNAEQVEPFEESGLLVSEMPPASQKMVWQLIEAYLEMLPQNMAKERSEKIKKEELGNLTFSWAGGTQLGEKHYYRIQGKSFLIEYDNVQNNANHIHCVWREFDGDFGRDLLKEHYHQHDHKSGTGHKHE